MKVLREQAAWLAAPIEWARAHVGLPARAPYVLSRALFPQARRIVFNAVGGVDLDSREVPMRTEVLHALRSAQDITVRDAITRRSLAAAGVTARLLPDPAVMVATLFGEVIRDRAARGPVSAIGADCPNGYIAMQFSADFGDDRTLDEIAAQLDRAAASHGLGVALFAAGIAPWHDDLRIYERIRQRMRSPRVHIMASPDIWDICALIATSRLYCGSSLHGRIVAAAFAVPRVNVRHPTRTTSRSKQSAFARTWEHPDMPVEVDVGRIRQGIDDALKIEASRLQGIASSLVDAYRAGFQH